MLIGETRAMRTINEIQKAIERQRSPVLIASRFPSFVAEQSSVMTANGYEPDDSMQVSSVTGETYQWWTLKGRNEVNKEMSNTNPQIEQVILSHEYQGREKLILSILLILAGNGDVAECDREWLCKATSYSQKRLDARLRYMADAGYLEVLPSTETQYRYRLMLKT